MLNLLLPVPKQLRSNKGSEVGGLVGRATQMLQVSRVDVDFSLFLSPLYNQGIKISDNKKNCWREILSTPALT